MGDDAATPRRVDEVGHRALVAYERPDGSYDLHYSHWGALGLLLAREISPGTPWGGSSSAGTPRVDPRPIATGLPLEAILTDHLDFLVHEAFYVVSTAWEVTAFCTIWFGMGDDPTVGNGAVVSARADDPADEPALRGWFRGARELLAELVEAGAIPRARASRHLEAAVLGLAGDGRQVHAPRARRR